MTFSRLLFEIRQLSPRTAVGLSFWEVQWWTAGLMSLARNKAEPLEVAVRQMTL